MNRASVALRRRESRRRRFALLFLPVFFAQQLLTFSTPSAFGDTDFDFFPGIRYDAFEEKIISSGAVTLDQGLTKLDTESDAASDDLDTINGTSNGDSGYFMAEDGARTVVLKDGTGNIESVSGSDIILDDAEDVVQWINSAGTIFVWIADGSGGGGGDTLPVVDTTGIAKGSVDATKIIRLEADGITTGTTRVLTMPDADVSLFLMDQNIRTSDAVTFATLDTGQGAYELYAMDQDALTTSNVSFNTLTAAGLITASANLTLGNGATTAGVLTINEDTDNGSNNASFTVPALAADTDYTLPPDDGDASEVLTTDGSGVLTWEAAGAGSSEWTDNGTNLTPNETGDDIILGDGVAAVTGKLEVGGDSDQEQFIVQGHSAQNFMVAGIFLHGETNPALEVSQSGIIRLRRGTASAGTLEIYEDADDGASAVTLTSPALVSSYTLTLPADDGDASEVLTTDGSGVLSWAAAASGAPDDAAYLTSGAVAGLSAEVDITASEITFGAGVSIGNGTTGAGFIDLEEDDDDGAHRLRIQAQAMAADLTYTMPADDGDSGEVLQTDGSGNLSWQPDAGAGGGISNIVEDVTPQLGGTLDANTFSIQIDNHTGLLDGSGDTALVISNIASAVNHFDIEPSATGNAVTLKSRGDDTNIPITIDPEGVANINLGGTGDDVVIADDLTVSGGLGGSLNLQGNQILSTAAEEITFHTDDNLDIILGDGSGADAVRIYDFTGTNEVGSIDSDGNAQFDGTLDVAGAVTFTTDLTVPNGGTGASAFADGGILLGSGTGAITATGQPTNGQLLIGSTGADPVLATLATEGGGEITVTNGAGTITLDIGADTLDFAELDDTLEIDAATTIDFNSGQLTSNYTGAGAVMFSESLTVSDDADGTDTARAHGITITNNSGDAGDTIEGVRISQAATAGDGVVDSGFIFDSAEDASGTTAAAFIAQGSTADAITTAFDASSAGILTALAIGSNQITTGATTIASTELDLIDAGVDITELNSGTKANLESILTDVADIAEADGDTYSGTHNFSGATVTLPADAVDAITELAAGIKSGSDATVITGTAGTNGDLAQWNADGDLVDGPTPPTGTILGTTDTQTVTNKTIDFDDNTINDVPQQMIFLVTPPDSDASTGTRKGFVIVVEEAMTVTDVYFNCDDQNKPAGSTAIVDINEDGTSILGTKLSIDAGEFRSATAASAATITDSAIDAGSVITIDVDQVGSTTAGRGFHVIIKYTVDY